MNERSITIAGGNLFIISSKYLGDATQWVRIARANSLLDPVITGLKTLILPPTTPNSGGGIGN